MEHAGLELRILACREVGVVLDFDCDGGIGVEARHLNLVILLVQQIAQVVADV